MVLENWTIIVFKDLAQWVSFNNISFSNIALASKKEKEKEKEKTISGGMEALGI